MSANFLYTLWNLCFLQLTNVLGMLLGYNILDINSDISSGVSTGNIRDTAAFGLENLYNNYFKPLALGILVSLIIIIALQKITYEGITRETGTKIAVGFILSVMIISNGYKLARNIVDFANASSVKIYNATDIKAKNDTFSSYELSGAIKAAMSGRDESSVSENDNFNSFKSFMQALDPSLNCEIKGITFDDLGNLKKQIYESAKANGGNLDKAIADNQGAIQAAAKYNIVFVNENGEEIHFFEMMTGRFLTIIALAVILLLFAIANFAAIAISTVVIMTRLVELGLRAIGIPFASLEFALNGYSSSSVRYFKSLVAVAIQGIFIVLILWLQSNMSRVFTAFFAKHTNGIAGAIPFMIFTIATIFTFTGLLVKSQQLAREIVGV